MSPSGFVTVTTMSLQSRPTCLAELNDLSRGQLQRLAKVRTRPQPGGLTGLQDCNIRANAKSADLRRLVAAHLGLGSAASTKCVCSLP